MYGLMKCMDSCKFAERMVKMQTATATTERRRREKHAVPAAELKLVQFRIDDETRRRLRVFCAERDISLNAALTDAVNNLLAANDANQGQLDLNG